MSNNLSDFDTADLLSEAERASVDRKALEVALTDEDVRSVADELGIDEQDLSEAAVRLTVRQRFAQKVAEHKRGILQILALISVLLLLTFSVGTLSANGKLSSLESVVIEQQSAMNRAGSSYNEIVADYLSSEMTATDRAVIEGARNRVRTESRRYDEAVAQYNDVADNFFGGWAATLLGRENSYLTSTQLSE